MRSISPSSPCLLLSLMTVVNGFVDVRSSKSSLSFVSSVRKRSSKKMIISSQSYKPLCMAINSDGNDVSNKKKETLTMSATVSQEEKEATESSNHNNIIIDPKAKSLKDELFQMSSATKRGFSASREERKKARNIIYNLAKYNPTKEPASSYYSSSPPLAEETETLSGKWTLIYTDAPDITSLDPSLSSSSFPSLIPPTAKLGRIGQECNPPFIKNVIEWNKPDWVPNFIPSLSSDRILQKVVCEASATPSNPKIVDLKLVGFDIEIPNDDNNSSSPPPPSSSSSSPSFLNNLRKLVPSTNDPLEIRGVVTVPFGTFELLYLDEEIRIIKTGQNYLAVNVRMQNKEDEWF